MRLTASARMAAVLAVPLAAAARFHLVGRRRLAERGASAAARVVAGAALLVAGVGLVAPQAASAASSISEAAASTPHVLGWSFDHPWGVSSDGTHVWVANNLKGVTEINASTGAVTSISGASYGFNGPDAVSSDARQSGTQPR